MSADIWMPWFPGDYQRDTQHLTTLEHGAYRLLIDACWCRGGTLPNDDGDLARIVHLQPQEWLAIRSRIAAFFNCDNGEWTHNRITRELDRARANSESQKTRTEAARKALQKKHGIVTKTVTDIVTKSTPPPPPPPPLTSASAPSPAPERESGRFAPPSLESVKLNASKIGLPDTEAIKFHAYYESNGWRVGRNPMKSWQAAMIHWRGNWQERNNGSKTQISVGNSPKGFDRSKGTHNEGTAKSYNYQAFQKARQIRDARRGELDKVP